MVGDFEKILPFTLEWERGHDPKNPKGNVDDKNDYGGRTSQGITQKTYDGACTAYGWPKGDVFDATDEQVKVIYRKRFWDRIQGDQLQWPFDAAMFDTCVLHKMTPIILGLQKIVGAAPDGEFGPATVAAVSKFGWVNSAWILLQGRDDRYEDIVHRDGSQKKFYGGWEARLDALTKLLGLPKTLDTQP